MRLTSQLFRALFAASALSAAAIPASGSDFPSKEIRFVVPWNAGGSNDIAARTISSILGEQGVRVIVENVPGATGAIGMQKVATATPDGYTIGMGTSSTLSLISQRLTPLRSDQFTPIVRVTKDPLVLLVPAGSPHDSLDAFVAHVKKNRGKVSIGTPGSNNLNHIFAVMTGQVANSEIIAVPYTGGSKVISDLAGKQIDAAVLKPGESKAAIDGNLVKPIAVFADARLAVLPNVPTFKEKGLDVFPHGPLVQMAYIVGPANLPPAVAEKLTALFRGAIQSPKFREVAAQGGALVDDLTGAALGREITAVENSLGIVGKQVFVAEKK